MSDSIAWRRSSFCEASACVEIALRDDEVLIRNSTRPDHVLAITRTEWAVLVADIRDAGDLVA